MKIIEKTLLTSIGIINKIYEYTREEEIMKDMLEGFKKESIEVVHSINELNKYIEHYINNIKK